MKGENISHRLARFGGAIVRLVRKLPRDDPGKMLSDQLLRAGTSPGAHYAEARSSVSARNFVYKVSLASGELREAMHWLEIVEAADETLKADVEPLMVEANELIAIFVASAKTARARSNGESESKHT